MKVILKTDVEALGRAGDVKDVADGFGRNFLLPRKLALPATLAALKVWERGKQKRAKELAGKQERLKELAGKINGVSLSFSRQAGAEGKLFGSVGKSDILKSLKSCGYAVAKDALVLEQSIKQVGDHEVEVRLLPEVGAKIKVTVVARE
ncbi:MAG: 50S ribosomal protein L9 [Elusimicrobia bacterium]|nr:50S ribosomal protein L9 [Elusimicrobiota bacterium]MDE2237971.1 50S ribosomal protein L9 [Elusimicrobiota bacterium]MDE2424563.1 50S ribosomal protein L9 [Elusimicrobiota bacterium]